MGQYVMGLDNGGTSTKAAIFDLQGREIATAGKQTSMITLEIRVHRERYGRALAGQLRLH